jgi:hypothetical protein
MTDDLWRWQASEIADGIKSGLIKIREAVESCLARLEQVNPKINAVIDMLADEALADADRADEQLARGDTLGALHGVPVTIKVNVDVAGRATTNGWSPSRTVSPKRTALVLPTGERPARLLSVAQTSHRLAHGVSLIMRSMAEHLIHGIEREPRAARAAESQQPSRSELERLRTATTAPAQSDIPHTPAELWELGRPSAGCRIMNKPPRKSHQLRRSKCARPACSHRSRSSSWTGDNGAAGCA